MSSPTEDATINPDGSQSSSEYTTNDDPTDKTFADDAEGDDPIIPTADRTYVLVILGLVFAAIFAVIIYQVRKRKKEDAQKFEFFDRLEAAQFSIKLPPPVEEYYQVKDKCISSGWEPGQGKPSQESDKNTPGRTLGQALMKRAIADIPLIQHMQKEAQGMYRLHGKNMCSEVQWRAFQNAEGLVSGEVDEVRKEAEEIEPGWGGMIWRQAAQYHGMLTQRAAQMQAQQAKAVAAQQNKPLTEQQKKALADRAAKELLAQEEKEKNKKGGGQKKKK